MYDVGVPCDGDIFWGCFSSIAELELDSIWDNGGLLLQWDAEDFEATVCQSQYLDNDNKEDSNQALTSMTDTGLSWGSIFVRVSDLIPNMLGINRWLRGCEDQCLNLTIDFVPFTTSIVHHYSGSVCLRRFKNLERLTLQMRSHHLEDILVNMTGLPPSIRELSLAMVQDNVGAAMFGVICPASSLKFKLERLAELSLIQLDMCIQKASEDYMERQRSALSAHFGGLPKQPHIEIELLIIGARV